MSNSLITKVLQLYLSAPAPCRSEVIIHSTAWSLGTGPPIAESTRSESVLVLPLSYSVFLKMTDVSSLTPSLGTAFSPQGLFLPPQLIPGRAVFLLPAQEINDLCNSSSSPEFSGHPLLLAQTQHSTAFCVTSAIHVVWAPHSSRHLHNQV